MNLKNALIALALIAAGYYIGNRMASGGWSMSGNSAMAG